MARRGTGLAPGVIEGLKVLFAGTKGLPCSYNSCDSWLRTHFQGSGVFLNIAAIITEIQSLGVRFHRNVLQRKGGAGPAEGGSLIVRDKAVNVPVASPFVSESPYQIQETDGQTFLFKAGKELFPVGLVNTPAFYGFSTEEGIPTASIALLHGKDCLASSVIQTCVYWNSEKRCQFCGIELSLKGNHTISRKSPAQLAEVAAIAKSHDGIKHVVLTTGTGSPPGSEIEGPGHMFQSHKKKDRTSCPRPVSAPPSLEMLHLLKEAGVDTVGIHIESFDPDTLKRVAPAKAVIGLKRYEEAWKAAVELFGPNQVSSFLVVGLGEKPDTVIWGSAMLADMGVYPFVVPLRPIPGSAMAKNLPPDPRIMEDIYEQVAVILKNKGLSSAACKAGCVRCGACSALSFYERPVDSLVCHPARTADERAQAFEIRKAVFVQEQKLFKDTDVDENDKNGIHLVARQGNSIIGTVRVYPAETGNGDWIGGRLAVKQGFRTSGAGELLVREAVAVVKKQGCNHFTAHIQKKNIAFFEQLGWRRTGPVKDYFGRPHQVMEADLIREEPVK